MASHESFMEEDATSLHASSVSQKDYEQILSNANAQYLCSILTG